MDGTVILSYDFSKNTTEIVETIKLPNSRFNLPEDDKSPPN